MKIRVSKRKTINTLLKTIASKVDEKYYFLPFWFERENNGDFVMHHLEELPNNLKSELIKPRNKQKL